MNTMADPVARYGELIDARLSERSGREAGWLSERRRRAGAQFRASGFPGRKHEAWRYTSVEPLLAQTFADSETVTALQATDLDELLIPHLDAWRIVLVNGHFAPHLSGLAGLPDGVVVNGLMHEIEAGVDWLEAHLSQAPDGAGEAFAQLNLAALQDGVALRVPAGVRLERPIEILHVSVGLDDAAVAQMRHVLVLEAGAEAVLVERHVSLGESLYFNNTVCDLVLQDGARLQHYRVQEESRNAFHVHRLVLRQAADSRYTGLGIALGGSWSRADWQVTFTGPGADCDLKGLYLVGDGQLVDNHLDVRHTAPACTSREDFRGVLNGRGRGVFDGRILVGKEAQKTDARLSNANLMLSRNAEIDTKPQLEIYADDVACSHGTTVGQIEPEALFYLRSRGIPEAQARRMICEGFARALYETCDQIELADYIEHQVSLRLTQEVAA